MVDQSSKRCVSANEHVENGSCVDKVGISKAVIEMEDVEVTASTHGGVCHVEQTARKLDPATFDRVKVWVIDHIHKKNHKLNNNILSAIDRRRLGNTRTNMVESFNAWMRRLNALWNGLRLDRNRIWVRESCEFYNEHLDECVPDDAVRSRRSSACSRMHKAMK